MTTAARPARGTRPANRRDLIVEAATELFRTRGYQPALDPMAELLRELDLTDRATVLPALARITLDHRGHRRSVPARGQAPPGSRARSPRGPGARHRPAPPRGHRRVPPSSRLSSGTCWRGRCSPWC